MKSKHMFAGVNSPHGFFSRFDSIMPEDAENRKIFLKGGPGTGKSTLMKKIAKRADEEGIFYEMFHCSSDPASADGIYLPLLKTAVVDATAPHGDDPLYPGAGGELFNAASCIRREKMQEHREELTLFTEKKRYAFSKGYHFLQAALPLIRDMDCDYRAVADLQGIYEESERIARRVFGSMDCKGTGRARNLFVSAVSPEGFVNYADTVFADTELTTVKGAYGTHIVLQRIVDIAIARGFTPTVFYCPMRPTEKIEHVYIPERNAAVTTYDYYTHCSGTETVDLDMYIGYSPNMGDSWSYASTLMQRAIDCFAEAKAAHGFLESFYTPAMDFDRLEEKGEELIQTIF